MKKLIPFFILLTFLFGFFSLSDGAISEKEITNILYVVESYGANTTASVKWKISKNFFAQEISPTASLGTNGVNQTTFSSASQALSTVETTLMTVISSYANSIAQYIKNNKITYAKVDWFYSFYDQSDSNTLKKVYLPLIIYPDGKLRNLGARVITTQPKILYYIYKAKQTEDIPPQWGYSDGGKLYKYVLDINFNTISYTVVDTGGRYDPPVLQPGDATIDLDSGIKFFIQEVASPEITKYSALFAMLDYARQVQPYYECDAQGNCETVVSVESYTRTLNISDSCTGPNDPLGGGQYQNTGRVGYTLQYTNERYLIEPNGNYTMTAQSIGYTTVGQNFNKTVQTSASSSSVLQYQIIDPFNTNQIYDYRNDTLNGLSCNRYIYAGAQCAQAPISLNASSVTWSFCAPYTSFIGDSCPFRFMVSDLGNNIVRWRIFNRNGQCVRFDTYKNVPYQDVSCMYIENYCYYDYDYRKLCCSYGEYGRGCYYCPAGYEYDEGRHYCCNYTTMYAKAMMVWEECGGDLHDTCGPPGFCCDTDSMFVYYDGSLGSSCLVGRNRGCRWYGYYNSPIKIFSAHRNACGGGWETSAVHGPRFIGDRCDNNIGITNYWNYYQNY